MDFLFTIYYRKNPCFFNTILHQALTYQMNQRNDAMSIQTKRIFYLLVIAITAFALGRLAVRDLLNLLLGGTLFGGNFL